MKKTISLVIQLIALLSFCTAQIKYDPKTTKILEVVRKYMDSKIQAESSGNLVLVDLYRNGVEVKYQGISEISGPIVTKIEHGIEYAIIPYSVKMAANNSFYKIGMNTAQLWTDFVCYSNRAVGGKSIKINKGNSINVIGKLKVIKKASKEWAVTGEMEPLVYAINNNYKWE